MRFFMDIAIHTDTIIPTMTTTGNAHAGLMSIHSENCSPDVAQHGIFLYAELSNVKRVNVIRLLHTGSYF